MRHQSHVDNSAVLPGDTFANLHPPAGGQQYIPTLDIMGADSACTPANILEIVGARLGLLDNKLSIPNDTCGWPT